MVEHGAFSLAPPAGLGRGLVSVPSIRKSISCAVRPGGLGTGAASAGAMVSASCGTSRSRVQPLNPALNTWVSPSMLPCRSIDATSERGIGPI